MQDYGGRVQELLEKMEELSPIAELWCEKYVAAQDSGGQIRDQN